MRITEKEVMLEPLLEEVSDARVTHLGRQNAAKRGVSR